MPQSWKQYRSAPPRGTRIVREESLDPQTALATTVETENGHFPLLVLSREGTITAYVNACPHQYLPLDQRGKNILSQDGETLRCTNHDATFSARTGEGIDGFGEGCALDAVPVKVDSTGWVVIDD